MPTFQDLLNSPRWLRTRRNHGLEHATIHVLTHNNPRRSVAGHSDAGGFWLLGDLTTAEIQLAADEALQRLRSGERWLAIHPNCGTNLVTAGLASGLAGGLALRGARRGEWFGRLPVAAVLSTLALLAARPLGTRLQERVTTSGDPGDLQIISIQRKQRGAYTAHRVETHST